MWIPFRGTARLRGQHYPTGFQMRHQFVPGAKLFSRAVILAVAALLTVPLETSAQLRRPKADVTPVVESDGVAAGATVRVALQVSLPEGLHVQSDAPRDPTLIPTLLSVEPPAGVTVDEIVYPQAQDFTMAGQAEPLAVFDRVFTVGARLTIASSVPAGDLAVPARLRYQACNDQMCFAPATADAQWTLRVVPAATRTSRQHQDVFTGLKFGSAKAPASAATAPPSAPLATTAPAASTTPQPAPGEVSAPTTPASAGAGDGLAALDRFDVVATTGGYLPSAEFIAFVRDAEQGVQQEGLLEGKGPLAILLLVFLGGLALNLTPCVLPMIPINLAIIGAGAQAGSRARGLLLGSAYGAAMALVYGVLGLVVILTAGTFGTINASPWFNLAIAIVFVLLALAMFDVFEIDLSRFSGGVGPGEGRGRLAVAFTMGAVAALLAGACVAPVVIQVVLFATNLYASGNVLALALPFVLGLGMALPWPLAGAGIAALPKPGAWMVRVKQAFGFVILVMAAYYGYLAYTLFANRWVDASAVTSSVEAKLKEGWHASLADGLAAAERDGTPALIDLWATWCKNCLTMDTTTFADPAVKSALAGYVKIKVQAEDPDEAQTRAIMQHFKAVGLPTYVIVKPRVRAPQ
jgi:cytochrome c biogenesis protein CcdA/DsbC/DsbD-like thiol-disulfide interchange protein